jgi:hypothetical protein
MLYWIKVLNHDDSNKLIAIFNESVDITDLKTIEHFAGIDYESIEGSNKSDKIRELIKRVVRHRSTNKLLSAIYSLSQLRALI